MTRGPARFAPAPERLDGLSDGVFAVVLTLLALELQLPDPRADESFVQIALDNSAVLETYVIAFFIAGVLWRLQHMVSELSPRGTPFLHSLTLAFLATVTLTPWSLDNLTSFPDDPVAVIAFSAILLASWSFLIAILTLALGPAEAERRDGIRHARLGLLGGPVAALASIGIAPLSTSLALYAWLLLVPYPYLVKWWARPMDEPD